MIFTLKSEILIKSFTKHDSLTALWKKTDFSKSHFNKTILELEKEGLLTVLRKNRKATIKLTYKGFKIMRFMKEIKRLMKNDIRTRK